MSALYFDARIDGDQLQKDIANINKQIGQISYNMQKEGQQIDAITGRIGRGLAGAFSIFTAGRFVKDIAMVRGEFQQLGIAFETMLGSKEKADKLFAEVVDFAQRTPFQLTEVAAGTKQLLAYGIAAEDILPTLKSLGDVSAGLSVPIERLILNYGQVRTQLHLTGRELRDFNLAGVPLIAELAKNLNVSEKEIAGLVERQKISFEQVRAAFQSMTEEGGRFNDLMDKQSKTITGLASNFKDAWDKMLNSMGESQEGIIADSIKGAIALTENYEKVIKILKVLIVTYGSYKAAVIAVATAQGAMRLVENIRLMAMFRKEIGLAAAAQQAFNVQAKANPYVLIGTAVLSLISYLIIFRKETKTTQDYIDDLNGSIESIGKQVEVDALINRYIDLQDKTEKTKEEQDELNTTIAELGKIFPGVISGTDQYGKVVDIAREKVIQLNDELRENARLSTEKQVADAQDVLNQKIAERAKLLKEANQGYVDTFVDFSQGQRMPIMVELVPEAIEERRKKVEELNVEINNLTSSITESEGKLQELGQIDATQALQPYRDLFGEVEKYSEDQALKIKEELTKLLFLGFGSEAEKQIKAEIDKIASQLALPTIQEQIQQVLSDLKSAQGQLDNLRAPGSKATVTQITDQEDVVKALQEKYDALTGVNRKERDKALKEQRKAELEQLKALTEFHSEQLSLERQLQASKISLMQQGADRRQAEAELQYQQELDRIGQQQQAYLEAWNASQGIEPGDIGFISELPEDEIEKFTQLRVNAEARKNQQIEQINRDTANEVKAIWSGVNEVYRTEAESDIDAINKRYDELIEKAKKAGETDFSSINEARAAAIEEATINAGMRMLQFEEEIEMQRAEISTQGFNRDLEIEKKKLEIVKDFAQQKIDLLKKSGRTESKEDIDRLKLLIKAADKGLKDLESRITSDLINSFSNLSSVVSKINADFGESLNIFSTLAQNANTFAANIGKGGDKVALLNAGIGVLGTYVEMFKSDSFVQGQGAEESIRRQNMLLSTMMTYLESLQGEDYFVYFRKSLEKYNAELDEAQTKLEEFKIIQLKERTPDGSAFVKIRTEGFELEDWIDLLNRMEKENVWDGHPAFEAMKAYVQQIQDLDIAIDKMLEQTWNKVTGTTIDSVADSIIDGFRKGYDSAEDFADNFEELMKTAIINSFRTQLMEGALTDWYKGFAEAGQNGYTEAEKSYWQNQWDKMVESEKLIWDSISEIAGTNLTDTESIIGRQGLTGAIKGITEETAGLIAGQFTAMREIGQKSYLTGIEQLASINESVTHLAAIEINTRHNAKLNSIDDRLADMNNYLKQSI